MVELKRKSRVRVAAGSLCVWLPRDAHSRRGWAQQCLAPPGAALLRQSFRQGCMGTIQQGPSGAFLSSQCHPTSTGQPGFQERLRAWGGSEAQAWGEWSGARRAGVVTAVALALTWAALAGWAGPAAAATFHVNETGDFIDTDLNDGLCKTALNTCSLRAAVMQANATAEADTIVLQAGQIYPLKLNTPGDEDAAAQDDLDISSKIFIDGNGGTIQVGPVGHPPTCNLNGTEELAWEFRVFHVLPAGELVLDSVTVRDGCADGSGAIAKGGGIFNGGKLTIRYSTVTANRARDGGGGLYNSGTVTVVNSTFSGNQASSGGGIQTENSLYGSFVTIVKNSASATAGGILANFASRSVAVTMKNCIVANNVAEVETATNNCFTLTSVSDPKWLSTGTNLAGGGGCPSFTPTSQLNLGPLANNGGLTETHALLSGSAAIDAATDCTDVDGTTVSRDQRGVARPRGSAQPPKCDVGAYEWDPDIPTPTPTATPTAAPTVCLDFTTCFPRETPTATETPIGTPTRSPSPTPTPSPSHTAVSPTVTPTVRPSPTPTPPLAPTSVGPSARCPAEPQPGCDQPRRSKLVIRKWPLEGQNGVELLLWRGRPRRDPSAFGNPLANTNTLVCIYGQNGLVLEFVVPPGAFWSRVGQRGFAYVDPAGSVGGVQWLSLERRAGWLARHETTIKLEAEGAGIPWVALPLAEPVTVQVRNDTTPVCFADTFAGEHVFANGSLLFRGIRR